MYSNTHNTIDTSGSTFRDKPQHVDYKCKLKTCTISINVKLEQATLAGPSDPADHLVITW